MSLKKRKSPETMVKCYCCSEELPFKHLEGLTERSHGDIIDTSSQRSFLADGVCSVKEAESGP